MTALLAALAVAAAAGAPLAIWHHLAHRRPARRRRIELEEYEHGYRCALEGRPRDPGRRYTIRWIRAAHDLGYSAGRRDRPYYLEALDDLEELEGRPRRHVRENPLPRTPHPGRPTRWHY